MNKFFEKRFYVGDFEITVREMIASISIVVILLLFGFLIGDAIQEKQMDKNEVYNKAVKIESTDMFEYGMRTNVGNAFVYGDLQAVDTVTYPEIGGAYMYVEKVKERYTMHTRTVTTTVNGRTQTRTETYWTWDRVGSEEIQCNEITFLGVTFDSDKIDLPVSEYITMIKESSHVRYKYYAVNTNYTGTIFTDLRNDTISDNSEFYNDMTIEETVDRLDSNAGLVIFWVLWSLLICGCVVGFYYIDNRWLE